MMIVGVIRAFRQLYRGGVHQRWIFQRHRFSVGFLVLHVHVCVKSQTCCCLDRWVWGFMLK